jgi:hypothetical protein
VEKYVFVILMKPNFEMFCWILENRILVNQKWKLENKSRLLTAFWYFEFFWSKIWFQCFPKKLLRKILKIMKISNFFLEFFFLFFNKLMLFEFSLAMSCYFYTPKYPQKRILTCVEFVINKICQVTWIRSVCGGPESF